MNEHIMVVDDEPSIITLLGFHLEKAGYRVSSATDGSDVIDRVAQDPPDLLILDLMLPGVEGMDVCKKLREKQWFMPIIMLTAKDDEFDKVIGLEVGADDYITKPFSPREVTSRVKAVLRRSTYVKESKAQTENMIEAGRLLIYPDKYEAYFAGEPIECTPKEFELLLYFMQHKGQVMKRDHLLNAVWHFDFMGDTRIVDAHVSHLRDKIEENTKKPRYIKTVHGLGYKLDVSE